MRCMLSGFSCTSGFGIGGVGSWGAIVCRTLRYRENFGRGVAAEGWSDILNCLDPWIVDHQYWDIVLWCFGGCARVRSMVGDGISKVNQEKGMKIFSVEAVKGVS